MSLGLLFGLLEVLLWLCLLFDCVMLVFSVVLLDYICWLWWLCCVDLFCELVVGGGVVCVLVDCNDFELGVVLSLALWWLCF